MSMEEFDTQVAWLGDQPSSSRGDGASTAQEPMTEEPPAPAPSPAAAEETTTPAQTPQPSPPFAPAPEETQPSALDINEGQPQEEQDV